MSSILIHLRKELQALADAKTKASAQKFFKEPIKAYGIKSPIVKALAKNTLKEVKNESKATIFAYCEELWKSGYSEEAHIACDWAYAQRKQFTADDFYTFQKWIDHYITNWASCDHFCNHTIGHILEQFPQHLPQLKKWATSENRWLRRAAAVSLIVPARKGKYLDIILEIATLQLTDEDDIVQKGYGWMLKVASKKHEPEVFRFVIVNKEAMPRTALRYAIELMPAKRKQQAMAR